MRAGKQDDQHLTRVELHHWVSQRCRCLIAGPGRAFWNLHWWPMNEQQKLPFNVFRCAATGAIRSFGSFDFMNMASNFLTLAPPSSYHCVSHAVRRHQRRCPAWFLPKCSKAGARTTNPAEQEFPPGKFSEIRPLPPAIATLFL